MRNISAAFIILLLAGNAHADSRSTFLENIEKGMTPEALGLPFELDEVTSIIAGRVIDNRDHIFMEYTVEIDGSPGDYIIPGVYSTPSEVEVHMRQYVQEDSENPFCGIGRRMLEVMQKYDLRALYLYKWENEPGTFTSYSRAARDCK